MLYSGKVFHLQLLSYKESNPDSLWLDLNPFISFLSKV